MLGFFKNIIGAVTDESQNSNDSSYSHSQSGHGEANDSRDYYWENKKLTEFLTTHFPNLSQKRYLYYQRRDGKSLEEIDISIYFENRDKFLVSENNLKKVAFAEYTLLPKEDLGVDIVLHRVEILEKYNKVIDQILQKSAARHYDKFRK